VIKVDHRVSLHDKCIIIAWFGLYTVPKIWHWCCTL